MASRNTEDVEVFDDNVAAEATGSQDGNTINEDGAVERLATWVRIKNGWPIQAHAAKIYTKDAYNLFVKELYKSTSYIVSKERDQHRYEDHFIVSHIEASKREKWSKVEFKVHIDEESKFHSCECGLYNHFGILCCHALLLLVQKGATTIPDIHIMARWTKDACAVNPSHLVQVEEPSNAFDSRHFRSDIIDDAVREFVSLANTDRDCFEVAISQITTVVKKLRRMRDSVRTECQVGFASTCSEYECSRAATSAGEMFTDTDDNMYCCIHFASIEALLLDELKSVGSRAKLVRQSVDSGYLGDAEPTDSGASDVAEGINALQAIDGGAVPLAQAGPVVPAALQGGVEAVAAEGYGDSSDDPGDGAAVHLEEDEAMSSSSCDQVHGSGLLHLPAAVSAGLVKQRNVAAYSIKDLCV
ncbi:hypothetical protein EJB05_51765, partial [Eragrostis curvula]